MCPSDDSHLTLEFHDHYVIRPTIKFHHSNIDYTINKLSEEGIEVPQGYEYNSGNNPHFLSIDKINIFNKKALEQEQSVHKKQPEMLTA